MDTPQLPSSALVTSLRLIRLPMENEPGAHLRRHYACDSQKPGYLILRCTMKMDHRERQSWPVLSGLESTCYINREIEMSSKESKLPQAAESYQTALYYDGETE